MQVPLKEKLERQKSQALNENYDEFILTYTPFSLLSPIFLVSGLNPF